MPLDLGWIREIRVNRSAVERRAASIPTRRSVKQDWQAGWLLRAITLMDLTTLQGDDTPGRVLRLCAKARQPVRLDLLEQLGLSDRDLRVAAVCVYHAFVETAVRALEGTGIPVAAVSTGFPAGLSPMPQRIAEIEASVAAGAREIDIVITRAWVLTSNWGALYDEVKAFRAAAGPAHLKAILGTGDLGTLREVARASMVAMMAGADFIKTSTGKVQKFLMRDESVKDLGLDVTDPEPLPSDVEGLAARPEADNLVGIHAALAGVGKDAVLRDFGGQQFSSFKKALAEVAVARLAPITGEAQRLMSDPRSIDSVLADGAERARAIAAPVMDKVKDIVGLIRA